MIVYLFLLIILFTFTLRIFTHFWSQSHIYTPANVPEKSTALVFGARVYSSGRPSAMLADRITAGVDLYKTGKVDYLLLTGDGRPPGYSETEAMRRTALALGVPDAAILLDPLGLRTYDSCYRASSVFGVTDAILVTQDFHVDRALLTCRGLGLDAAAVSADYQRPSGYSRYSLSFSRLREFPATLAALIDIIYKAPPANSPIK